MKDTPADIVLLVLAMCLVLVFGLLLDKHSRELDRLETRIVMLEQRK